MTEKVKLNLEGKDYEFDITVGSENEKCIDITKLRSETGYITMDQGFGNTGSTFSSITYVDGANGILRYRGYSIEELANNAFLALVRSTQAKLHVNLCLWKRDNKPPPQRTLGRLIVLYPPLLTESYLLQSPDQFLLDFSSFA